MDILPHSLALCARVVMLGAVCGLSPTAQGATRPAAVQRVALSSIAGGTQVDLSVDRLVTAHLFTLSTPDRIVLDLAPAVLDDHHVKFPAGAGLVHRIRCAPREGGGLRFVFEVDPQTTARLLDAGRGHVVVALNPISQGLSKPELVGGAKAIQSAPVPMEAGVVATAEAVALPRSVPMRTAVMARVSGARVLVIAVDAGHGGEDPGASGPEGTHEKDVTLAIAQELAGRINAEPGMRAVLTRPDDRFVPLRERIHRARRAQADLFVSVHADAVPDRSVSGASVYVLSARGASSEAAKWLADQENAADLVGGVSLDDKDNVLASVLLDLSQSAAMSASMGAAEKVLSELNTVGEVRKARVQQAGFVVLKSPDIPSMLIETAYITNPGEEKRLRDERYQQRLASAILAGIRNYFHDSPLPGTRLASLPAEHSSETRTR